MTAQSADVAPALICANASIPQCRFCGRASLRTFVNLGVSPLCQKHLAPHELNRIERFYPLHAYVCDQCFLVQLDEYARPNELFEEYAYFSSYSDSWVEHARQYVESAISRFGIGAHSFVVEVASNDGYLLQHFLKKDIRVLGIEPAGNVARAAIAKGVPTEVMFFDSNNAALVAQKYGRPDLIVGNNVLAHVPALNDFVRGLRILLAPSGIVTMEFPHLLRLLEDNQFDTIYHEHFSYFSLGTVERVFAAQDLTVFDVDQLPTHGGSLRIYARHREDVRKFVQDSVRRIKTEETRQGLGNMETYTDFSRRVNEAKYALLDFLIAQKRAGKSIVGYGAPGKGSTLLNYCGIGNDLLDYTVDRSPYKQGKYTPGRRVAIHSPERIKETRPDYLLVLPWNLKDEIIAQTSFIRTWGGKWIVPIPRLEVIR